MTDPLSITASVVAITTAAIGSVKFLYTTIGDIKDVPTALGSVKSDLGAIEPILQKLRSELDAEDSKVPLMDDIKGAVENCNSACSTFQKSLDHWMRHATKYQAFWAEWTDRVRVGIFEKGEINVFKGRLDSCKGTINVALSTSTMNIHDRIEQEIKDTKAEDNSKAVAGLINTTREYPNIKQNISNTSAKGGSFAGAGIIQGLDLSIPSSRNQ